MGRQNRQARNSNYYNLVTVFFAASAPQAPRVAPGTPPDAAAVAEALALTGHFLEARLAPGLPRGAVPSARGRAVAALRAWPGIGRAG